MSTIAIRGLSSEDWDSLFALLSMEALVRNSVALPYISEEAFRDQIGSGGADQHVLLVDEHLPSGRKRLVGIAWLDVMKDRRRHAGRLSFAVRPDYRESLAETKLMQAVLDLADNWLGLRRLETVAYVDDQQSINLLTSHDFVVEATMRHYAMRDGVCSAAYMLARLRLPSIPK